MPRAAARLLRDRLVVLSAVVLLFAVLSSVLLQERSDAALQSTLDTSWRGAYDLLVRPSGQDYGAADTGGLIEGNFVSVSGAGGITESQLADIRSISGVEVAAPIGLVGRLAFASSGVNIEVQDPLSGGQSVLSDVPELYRVTQSLQLADASGSRTVEETHYDLVLQAQRSSDTGALKATSYNVAASSSDQNLYITGPALPTFASSVVAVDPVAERALLGESGAFLDGLTTAPDPDDRGAADVVSAPWWNDLYLDYPVPASQVEVAAESAATNDQPVVPLLVNTSPGSALTLKVEVFGSSQQPGPEITTAQTLRDFVRPDEFRSIGTSELDLSAALVPFDVPSLTVPWPGSTQLAGEEMYYSTASPDLIPSIVGRPTYLAQATLGSRTGPPAFNVVPQGVVAIDGSPIEEARASSPGVHGVQSYRTPLLTADEQRSGPGGTAQAGRLMMPIGSFSLDNLDFGQDTVSYVPYGVYDPARTELLRTPDGLPIDPIPVVAQPSGVDFISGLPGALTDLAGGRELRGSAPIDAIRVRVGGITDYDDVAVGRIADIAGQIASLGLEVSVVAGSSPQPVELYVQGYVVAADLTSSDLGWVGQDWTTLGAALQVKSGLSSLSLILLYAALASGALAFVGSIAVSAYARRGEVRVLRRIGWQDSQVRRWVAGEYVVLLLAVAAACGVVVAVSGMAPATMAAAAIAIGIAAVGAGSAALSAVARTGSVSRRTWKVLSRSGVPRRPSSIAVRQWLDSPARSGMRVLSSALVALGISLSVLALSDANRRAGATRLAGLAVTNTSTGHLLLTGVTIASGLLLALTSSSMGRSANRDQHQSLTSAGWQPSQIRRIDRTKSVLSGIVSLAIVIPATRVIAGQVSDHDQVAATSVAVLAVAGLVAATFVDVSIRTRSKGK